jgi:hypothetical protein
MGIRANRYYVTASDPVIVARPEICASTPSSHQPVIKEGCIPHRTTATHSSIIPHIARRSSAILHSLAASYLTLCELR